MARTGTRQAGAPAGSRLTIDDVGLALALAGAVLFIGAGLAYTARLVHVGNLDALALAEKMATPDPVHPLDWPELQVRAVLPQPGEPSLVLLLAEWPARPGQSATLLIRLDQGDERSVPLLSQWCAALASIAPTRMGDGRIELRRRQSLERVRGLAVGDDCAVTLPAAPPAGTRRGQGQAGPG